MIQKKINIAFLGNQIAWGGGAKSLLLLIKSFRNFNGNLFLYVTHCSSEEMKSEFDEYVEFVKIINLPEVTSAQTQSINQNIGPLRSNEVDTSPVVAFAKELNYYNIDILHINNSVFAPIYSIIKSSTKVKIVTHVREWIHWNGINQKQEYIINNIYNNSDAIICISDNEAEVFSQHNNLTIIPNPFDFNYLNSLSFNRSDVMKTLGFDDNCFLIGIMGRAQRNKGFMDFLRIVVNLRQKYDIEEIKFVVLGAELSLKPHFFKHLLKRVLGKNVFPYEVHKYMKKNELFNKVRFIGNRKEVFEIINSFDIAIRTSYSGDPWGRDIIEYMALRKPIVATGYSEFYLKQGETGFLVEPRDIEGFSEKIVWLYNNKSKGIEIGENAYKAIYRKCNMNVFHESVLNVYNRLM